MNASTNTYDEMFEVICANKDFGKRNPVDIGIECGYSENEVLEMMKYLSENESLSTGTENNYYFLLRRLDDGIIVSVNTKEWSVKKIEKIRGFYETRWKWAIRGNVFAWGDGYVLRWRNLKTGKEGEKNFQNDYFCALQICESGIFVVFNDKYMHIGFDGKTDTVSSKAHCWEENLLVLEGEEKYYIVRETEIWSMGKNLQNQCRICRVKKNYSWDKCIEDAGIEDGKIYYDYRKEVDIGDYRIADRYEKYTEEGELEQVIADNPRHREMDMRSSELTVGIITENYRLLGQKIYTRDGRFARCIFPRIVDHALTCKNFYQTVGIYDEDIFIGVGKRCDGDFKEEEQIIKYDCNKDEQPFFLNISETLF